MFRKIYRDCIDVNEDTYLIKGESDITVGSLCEIVRVSSDRNTRCRTVQLFKDGKPWMIVNVVEQKVSNETHLSKWILNMINHG